MTTAIRRCLNGLADGKGCQNAGLALERYLKGHDKVREADNKEFAPNHHLLSNVAGVQASGAYRIAYERWKRLLEERTGTKIALFKPVDRLIVGLGSESVIETAITLSRGYGQPIIPGSALKGLTRHYFLHEVAGVRQERDLSAEHRAIYDVLFGSTKSAGYITFFDAWFDPSTSNGRPFRRDVMTPHHMNYYSSQGKDAAPTDFDDPNPVAFVSAVGSYLVAIEGPTEQWTDYAFEVVTKALADYGVGGKTSSGYGKLVAAGGSGPTGSSTQAEQGTQQPPVFDPKRSQLCQRIQTIPGKELPNRLYGCYESWTKLPDGPEKTAVAKLLREKLQSTAVKGRWEGKPLADVTAYLDQTQ